MAIFVGRLRKVILTLFFAVVAVIAALYVLLLSSTLFLPSGYEETEALISERLQEGNCENFTGTDEVTLQNQFSELLKSYYTERLPRSALQCKFGFTSSKLEFIPNDCKLCNCSMQRTYSKGARALYWYGSYVPRSEREGGIIIAFSDCGKALIVHQW